MRNFTHWFIRNAQAFTIINGTPVSGTFDSVGVLGLGLAEVATTTYNANSVVVTLSKPAMHFGVVAPAFTTVSSAFNLSVTALDSANNTDIGYTGTVLFTSSDSNAMLPAGTTLTNGTDVHFQYDRCLYHHQRRHTDLRQYRHVLDRCRSGRR